MFLRDFTGNPTYSQVDWDTYAELTEVPIATSNWYRSLADRNKRGAVFAGVPHLMIRGAIDVTNCLVIDWSMSQGQPSD
jgi:hypothetical protein